MGRGAEAEVGDVAPVLLVVAAEEPRRGSEIGDLVMDEARGLEEPRSQEKKAPYPSSPGRRTSPPLAIAARGVAAFHGQLIARKMGRPEGDRLLERGLPCFFVCPGSP